MASQAALGEGRTKLVTCGSARQRKRLTSSGSRQRSTLPNGASETLHTNPTKGVQE